MSSKGQVRPGARSGQIQPGARSGAGASDPTVLPPASTATRGDATGVKARTALEHSVGYHARGAATQSGGQQQLAARISISGLISGFLSDSYRDLDRFLSRDLIDADGGPQNESRFSC